MEGRQREADDVDAAQRALAVETLTRLTHGDSRAADSLFPLVYERLRRLAASWMRSAAGHTLQPTALVNEAYLRMISSAPRGASGEQGRAHFFAVAARAMRHLLIQRARARGALKRGGALERAPLVDVEDPGSKVEGSAAELLALDEALSVLSGVHERQAKVVEMRFFAGASVRETAEALGVSDRTVEMDWRAARAWLAARMEGEARPG